VKHLHDGDSAFLLNCAYYRAPRVDLSLGQQTRLPGVSLSTFVIGDNRRAPI
jgi:hypothetical protein